MYVGSIIPRAGVQFWIQSELGVSICSLLPIWTLINCFSSVLPTVVD